MSGRRRGGGRERGNDDCVELMPNEFQLNQRVAAVLLPCWVVIFMFGGKTVASILAVGVIVAYMFDLTNVREGSLIMLWITFLGVALTLFVGIVTLLSTNIYLLFLLVCMNMIVMLTGVWMTLQFKWLQRESPALTLLMERALITCSGPPAAVLVVWALVSAYGFDGFGLYVSGALFWSVACLGVPLQSSFVVKDRTVATQDFFVADATAAKVLLLNLVITPLLAHMALHHSAIGERENLYMLLVLVCLPVLMLRALDSHYVLWCLAMEREAQTKLLNVGTLVAAGVLLGVVEMRVVFQTYGHYIVLQPPLSYALVTLAMYGGAALGFLVLTGVVQQPLVLHVLGGGAALALALVLGLPAPLVPVPVLAAISLVHFRVTKQFRAYLVFVLATITFVGWFNHAQFFFLEFRFETFDLSLHAVSTGMEALLGLCLIVPGLALTNVSPPLTALVLMVHALGVALLECTLLRQGEGMYPPVMVAFTSGVGYLLATRLAAEKRITQTVASILFAMYASKSVIIFVDDPYAFVASLAVLLTVVPAFAAPSSGSASVQMSQTKALWHAAAIAGTFYSTRHVLISNIVCMLLGLDRITPSALCGYVVLATVLGTSPLTRQNFGAVGAVPLRRVHAFLVLVGLQLVLIAPSSHSSIFSAEATTPRGAMSSWLLLLGLSLVAASATSVLPLPHSLAARILVSVGVGASLGLYVVDQFVPHSVALHALMIGAVVCAVTFTVFTRYPTAQSHRFMPALFGVLVAILPVAYLTQSELYMHKSGMAALEEFLQHRTALVALYAALMLVVALSVKLGDEAQQRAAKGHKGAKGQKVNKYVGRASVSRDMEYLPMCGSIAALLSFLLCIDLNFRYLEGGLYCIPVLSSIMLLLSPGRTFSDVLNDGNRYAPMLTVTGVSCVIATFWEIGQLRNQTASDLFDDSGEGMASFTWLATKNLALAVLSAFTLYPAHQFVWHEERQGQWYWLTVAPLNLLPAVASTLDGPCMLGWLGFVSGILCYASSWFSHQRGLKII